MLTNSLRFPIISFQFHHEPSDLFSNLIADRISDLACPSYPVDSIPISPWRHTCIETPSWCTIHNRPTSYCCCCACARHWEVSWRFDARRGMITIAPSWINVGTLVLHLHSAARARTMGVSSRATWHICHTYDSFVTRATQ